MTDTFIHAINERNSNLPTLSPESTGQISGRSVSIDPKWRPLLIAFIILNLLGLAVAGCGIAALGIQQHWWSIGGLLNQVNQTNALIASLGGGVLGTVFLIVGSVGLIKTFRKKNDRIPLSTSTTTRRDNTKKQQTTNRKGHICITTHKTGNYIGDPTQRQLLPAYLKEITLEDDSPLPLDAKDFFCELYLFNMSSQLKNLRIPSTLYLPGALFKGKKDSDVIRLKYKNKLIELVIEQQNHGLKFEKGSFEDVFNKQTAYIKNSCDPICPLFNINDPYWFYKLGENGVIYKLETDTSEKDLIVFHLKEGTAADFRPHVAPTEVKGQIYLDEKNLIFSIEFCSFEPKDFDILLNETHLIIYGRFENRPLSNLLPQADFMRTDVNVDESPSRSREGLIAYRWDRTEYFRGRSLEEMKSTMKSSTLSLTRGILQIEIPLPE